MARAFDIIKPALRGLKFEMRTFVRHWLSWLANRNRFRGQTGLKVNVGCGGSGREGWVNMDLSSDPGVLRWDIRHPLPFDEASVAVIFTEHFFEHLDHPTYSIPFLAECLRCLAPGGVLRVIVPDGGAYVAAYGGPWDKLVEMRPLQAVDGGYRDRWTGQVFTSQMALINEVFRQSGEHRFAYDAETLIATFHRAGFTQASRVAFGESANPDALLDMAERASESLYVEGVKPLAG